MTGDIFFKTVSHFFPKLTKWLESVDDPRNENKIIYKPSHLLWLGIFLFLLRLGSKRKIKYRLSTEEFLKNLNQLAAGYSENVAHHDTVEYFLGKLESEEIYMYIANEKYPTFHSKSTPHFIKKLINFNPFFYPFILNLYK